MGILQPILFGNGTESCLNSPLPTVSQGEEATAGAAFALDTLLCGQSKKTDGLPLFSGGVSQNAKLSKQTSGNFPTNSSPLSLFRRFISSERLAPIFQLLGKEPGLQELVEACFIRDSDFFDYSKLRTLSLRMSKGFLAAPPTQHHYRQLELFSALKLEDGESHRRHVQSRSQLRTSIRARISSASSGSLGKWGMTAHGRSETDIAGCHKTAPEFSLLVVTGNVQCRKIEPNRPTLQECLDDLEAILDQYSSGDRLKCEETPPLTSLCGSHWNAVIGSPNSGWQGTVESPTLTSSGWLHSPSAETQKSGKRLAVMYRGAAGDRTYTELAPTLRSLANTGGKHQGGGGAWKVVEYKGEDYLVSSQLPEEACSLASTCSHLRTGARPRKLKDGLAALIPTCYRRQRPLTATEFERLMGWPVGSTEKGITASGKEITISKTQRQKMLGNGIIPHEIEDICNKLKPFIASSDPDSQPKPRSGS